MEAVVAVVGAVVAVRLTQPVHWLQEVQLLL